MGEEGANTLEEFREEVEGLDKCLKGCSKELYRLLEPLLLRSMKYLDSRDMKECKLMEDAIAEVYLDIYIYLSKMNSQPFFFFFFFFYSSKKYTTKISTISLLFHIQPFLELLLMLLGGCTLFTQWNPLCFTGMITPIIERERERERERGRHLF